MAKTQFKAEKSQPCNADRHTTFVCFNGSFVAFYVFEISRMNGIVYLWEALMFCHIFTKQSNYASHARTQWPKQ